MVVSQFKLFINRLFRQLNRVIGKIGKPKTICELSVGYMPEIKKGPNVGALDVSDWFEKLKDGCRIDGERYYIGELMAGKGNIMERITQEDIDLAFIGDSKELVTHIAGQNP